MDFLYIFMNHLCPSIGAVIALMMFASPMKAVMRANKEKNLGVRWLLVFLMRCDKAATKCWSSAAAVVAGGVLLTF
jgi:hypothetical protein